MVSCVVTVILILMIIMFNFSQMIMETWAYSFMISENDKTIKVMQANEKLNRHLTEKHTEEKKKQTDVNSAQTDIHSSQTVPNAMIHFIKPVSGGVTTSVFGDVIDRKTTHLGHDWAVEVGTNVCAVADGTVEKAYLSDSYGYNILVNHGNGLKTRYAHLSKILINLGDRVEQGRIIGLSGNTGDSTGPHLHFEVMQNDRYVNPLNFLK